jgi:gliding motility-associated-like protein
VAGKKSARLKRHFYIAITIVFILFLPGILKAQIIVTGSPAALSSSYGTPSSSTSFAVSGTNLTSGILVTPPFGFEISLDNINYSNTITADAATAISPKLFYIRLKSTTPVGTYTGNIVLSSQGASSTNITMPISMVTHAALIITAKDVSKTYGSVLTDAAGSTFFTANGLKNTETIDNVSIAYGSGSAALVNVGTYPGSVTVSNPAGGTFRADNYTISYVDGNIIVSQARLIVTANDTNKLYGDPNPAFTATYQGFVNGDGIAQITTQPTFTSGTAPTSPVGQYTITASGGVAPNYLFLYVPGILTINPAPLIVTADNKSRLQGDPNPVFTATYKGFVNGENPAQLTDPPDISTNATPLSPVGQYLITPSGGVAFNYAFIYVSGILTVNAAELDLGIPNTFTPNGDGVNDTWNIKNLDTYTNTTVEILSRYGARIFFSNGYPVPWDGKYKGADVPSGTYYYIITTGAGKKPHIGFVAIVR